MLGYTAPPEPASLAAVLFIRVDDRNVVGVSWSGDDSCGKVLCLGGGVSRVVRVEPLALVDRLQLELV